MDNKSVDNKKSLVIKIDYDMWKNLRRVSYETNIPQSQLVRWSVQKIIDKYSKNKVDNS